MAINKKEYYFLFNFEQARNFDEKYAKYRRSETGNRGWYRTVLYYTTIYGLPDAVCWLLPQFAAIEIIEEYDLQLMKATETSEFWKFK